MGYSTLTGGLELVIPDSGEENWSRIVRSATWQKINDHTHSGSGDGNPIPTGGLANYAVTKEKLSKNLAFNQQSLAPSGTTQTINFDDGQKVLLDLSSATGDVTLTFNNPIAGATYTLFVSQGATARTLVWPVAVIFHGGVEMSQYMSANKPGVFVLEYDGTNYFAIIQEIDME